ncbi:PIN domain-containing protein [Sphingorhabdus sp.]|uniref:PIN domain-containing protein n=1 Tax=Sphingorhabdus sp. TaxID=1902408 RepID=UPI003BAF26A5|nr:PIN domain-containing protein [Sphingomonadales bacterium]MBK9431206.1 PIN domain-containing protein [Sphingomonadales bacterium]MBL0021339.1 PIN domain-containing protein [Sphingomonadales bacterium]
MAILLDTSIAIHLRDDGGVIGKRISNVTTQVFLSSISRVELEGGVASIPELMPLRRAKLDVLLDTLDIIDFTDKMAEIYGEIVARAGFNRRKIIDRMIAATAMAADLTLITSNGDDFADIEGLKLEFWNL